MERLPVFFKDDIQMSGAPAIVITPTVVAPSAPLAAPKAPEMFPEVNVEDITDLTDDDLELVEVEVEKLLGKTIKEAEPILIATGGSPHLPRTLRVLYLEEVQKHPKIQQTLKEVAEKLLAQL
jgi:lysine/ornithine N-monooxygenase